MLYLDDERGPAEAGRVRRRSRSARRTPGAARARRAGSRWRRRVRAGAGEPPDTFFVGPTPDTEPAAARPARPAQPQPVPAQPGRHGHRQAEAGRAGRQPTVSASMATAALAYSGITVKMLVDKRLDAQLQTMFMVGYQPGAVAHPARPSVRGVVRHARGRGRGRRRRPALHASPRRRLLDRRRLHPRLLRDDGNTVLWLETSAPGPPDRHSYRFERDWEYLAARLSDAASVAAARLGSNAMEARASRTSPCSPSPSALGERLRAERKSRHMTVREIARRVGVSPSLISQIERDKVNPSVSTLWGLVTRARPADGRPVLRRTTAAAACAGRESRRAAGRSRRPGTRSRDQPRDRRTLGAPHRRRATRSSSSSSVVYPPGAASCDEDSLIRHGGKEYGYVTSGRLGVRIGFDEYELGPGWPSRSTLSPAPAVGDRRPAGRGDLGRRRAAERHAWTAHLTVAGFAHTPLVTFTNPARCASTDESRSAERSTHSSDEPEPRAAWRGADDGDGRAVPREAREG